MLALILTQVDSMKNPDDHSPNGVAVSFSFTRQRAKGEPLVLCAPYRSRVGPA